MLGLLLMGWMTACEDPIEVDLPDVEQKIVVEGSIEQTQPPFVVLTRSTEYFEPTNLESFENSFVHDAVITVNNGDEEITLEELCSATLPDEFRPIAAELLGVPLSSLQSINYCIYTVPLLDLLGGNFFQGEIGKRYDLRVQVEGKTFTAATNIQEPIPLDSIWYEPRGGDTTEIEGVIWAQLTDPDSIGNAYRWQARIFNKSTVFVAPFNSAFRDEFINGTTFDFGYIHGDDPNTLEGQRFFQSGDTVIVKFSAIDRPFYRFLRVFESEVANNGNPFAAPTTIPSNIEGDGGLGIWGGYGADYDTVICR
ncbi:MAG: DUF4249 domain-containing protein [Salibacteraceae bacterium]